MVPLETKPYRGAESFRAEHAHLFFGRDNSAEQLIAFILSGPVTVLHAQSGAGKTSLLNALVMPELEKRGWTPVRVLPGDDPIEAVRKTVLGALLPPPEAERLALDRACGALFSRDEDPTIDQLLARYDQLPAADPRKSELVRPMALSEDEGGERIPALACRLLRECLELSRFGDHLRALLGSDDSNPGFRVHLDGDTRVAELSELLSHPALIAGHRSLLAELEVAALGLGPFLERLLGTLAARGDSRRLLLLFDQFEEVFTRFVDPERPGAPQSVRPGPSYQMRDELFEELAEIFRRARPCEDDSPGPSGEPLVVRCVFSMRSEYIAQLDRKLHTHFPMLLAERAFHLALLTRPQAAEAITKPAARFGYTYSSQCFTAMLDQLTKEGVWIEPTHLQIVCERLWDRERQREVETTREIAVESLDALGGVQGILGSFFEDFLRTLDTSEVYEVLEILGGLVTVAGTRNIVEKSVLLHAPLRDVGLRRSLVERLVDERIIRVETRLDSEFVEITHEFLIDPILKATEERLIRDRAFADLQKVRHALDRLQRGDTRATVTEEELLLLHRYRERVRWQGWAREAVFRSAIALGADRSLLSVWSEELTKDSESRDLLGVLAEKEHHLVRREREQAMLSRDELRAVNELRDSLILSPARVELVLRSILRHAMSDERRDIMYWSRRLEIHADEPDQHRR